MASRAKARLVRELLLKKTLSGLGKRKGFYVSVAKCREQVCMVSKTTNQRTQHDQTCTYLDFCLTRYCSHGVRFRLDGH